jgi:thymidylate kinase
MTSINKINYTIVSIEGNIGSGKSTLQTTLRKHYENNPYVVFLREPVDDWEKIKDEDGNTILEKFYADQNKYSFSFQMMAYVSRLKVLRDTMKDLQKLPDIENKNVVIITERSLYTDKLVFAKMLFDSGKIEYINYQIYLNWFDTFSEEFPIHKIIYVKTKPELCHKRINVRSRDGESNISLSYLHSCDLYHENMLNSETEFVCNDQLVLNGNVDIYENQTQLDEWIKQIDDFVANKSENKS